MKKIRGITYYDDVWEALNLRPEVAENLRLRSHAMIHIRETIKKRRLTQVRAAKVLRVSQPRVSALMNGHIDKFSLDALIEMLSCLGYKVRLTVQRAA
jgi:predicted XRE-type DNA-binding protein